MAGLLLLLSASILAAPSPRVRLDGDWIRVETPHFLVYSGASASKAKEIALDLERFRAVLLRLKPSSAENAPVPTTVFVFPSDSAMNPYKPRFGGKPRNVSGLFRATREGNYIALAASWNTDPRRVIYHEYFHYFMHSNFAPQPTWYDEGAAEFYSTFRSTSNEAQIGLAVEEHLRTLRDARMLSLPELFAVGRDSPDYNDPNKQEVFYAESWALVHYLLRTEPKRAADFGRFLVRLQKGEDALEAFRRELGVEPDEVFRQLYRYVRQARFSYSRILFSELKVPGSGEAVVAPLRWEDAVTQLGDLLAHGDEDQLEDAQAHFEAALARSPLDPGALAGLGFCRIRRGRYEEAADFLKRSVDAGSTDFRVAYRLGDLRMRALGSRVPTAEELEEARAAFRRSLDLNPSYAEARGGIGRTYLFDDPSAARQGIAVLEAAVRELPSRVDLALDLAALYRRAGDTARSDEIRRKIRGADARLPRAHE